MIISVSSYSYSRLVRSGALGQLDVPAKAKEMGFDTIEFSTFALPEGETPLTFAPKVKEACAKAGIRITNYTIGADFLKNPKGWEAEAERLKDEVRVAAILGAPGMRHDVTGGFPADKKGGRSFDDALPTLVKGVRAVTEFAADQGVKTMSENHGRFAQASRCVEKLICGVNHPNYGALIDIGNFLVADDEPGEAVGRLAPYAFHVHAKDMLWKDGNGPDPGEGWFRTNGGNFLRGTVVGHGVVPVVKCLSILKAGGYDGIVSIEFEGAEDVIESIRKGKDNLARYVAMI